MTTKKSPKLAILFDCDKCNYKCYKKSDFTKHCSTRKHQNTTNDNKKVAKSRHMMLCSCGKSYQHRASLFNHKKTCKIDNDIISIDKDNIELNHLTNMVMELMKSNNEMQKQLVDVCKNSNINVTNNTNSINNNSNNKTFNLQFFLNEQCKDAMNISDFANSFDLQLSDLESVGNLGYIEGITKIIVDKLHTMDIYKRPMHCSDVKREILYIKDEDKWVKEPKNSPKLRHAIKTVSFKSMKLTNLWSDTYPESKNGDSRLNDKYMKLIKESTGGNGEICESENKIIRRITKEIIIEK